LFKKGDRLMRNSYDVIIAGSGIAGLHAALCLDSRLSVLVISKSELALNNSALAQGGVAAVLDLSDDNKQLHFDDTMIAGGNTNNREAVRVLVEEGPENVLGLAKYGVRFDERDDGSLSLTLEGGHSRHRIAHHSDTTGFEIESKLLASALSHANIDVLSHSTLMKLKLDDCGFYAGIFIEGRLATVRARALIMATGGDGRVFKYTTNSTIATGDGIFLAGALGARIKNLSLVQFHPTAFAGQAAQQRFLISESVRGEGAVLLNCNGERFMQGYDPRLELAARDVVSQAIRSEALKTGSEDFYLDISFIDHEFVKNRFPAIFKKCLEYGVDMTTDKIPVFPCQHYLMGGIDVDTYARASIPGLYAVGECSHTGVHGRNRLASNSLLEALVFSKRAADDIMNNISLKASAGSFGFKLTHGAAMPHDYIGEVQDIMQSSYFIIPDKAACARNLPRINEIFSELENGKYADSPALLESQSLSFIAKMTITEVLNQ